MEKRDLTQGSVAHNLLYMAIPTMFGAMSRTLYDLVDMIWIGQLSAKSVASVTIFASVFWLFMVLNIIVGAGSVSLISQTYGAGDKERVKRIIEQTFTFKALLGVVAMLFLLTFLRPMMSFFSTDAVVVGGAVAYGRIRSLFVPVFFSSATVLTALRCTGDAKKPMMIMMIASVINIILDPLFIFETVPFLQIRGLGLGISGAAWATVLAQTISFILGAWLLFSGKGPVKPELKGLLKLIPDIDRKLFTVGIPRGVESFIRMGAGTVIIKFVTMFGSDAVAAVGIANRLLNFSFMPLEGLLSGGSVLVGQCLGAQKVSRAEKTARMAALMGGGAMAFFAVLALLIPEQLMHIFVKEPGVIALGSMTLRIMLPALISVGLGLGFATSMMGSGYNRPFLVAMTISRWVIQIPFLWITVGILHMSYVFVPIANAIAFITEGIIFYFAFKQGKWKHAHENKAIAAQ